MANRRTEISCALVDAIARVEAPEGFSMTYGYSIEMRALVFTVTSDGIPNHEHQFAVPERDLVEPGYGCMRILTEKLKESVAALMQHTLPT